MVFPHTSDEADALAIFLKLDRFKEGSLLNAEKLDPYSVLAHPCTSRLCTWSFTIMTARGDARCSALLDDPRKRQEALK